MTSKRAPSARRAVLPRASDRTKPFVKDWTRLSHSGRYDMKRLKEAMLLLVARDEPLGRSGSITRWPVNGPTIGSATSVATSC